AGPDCCVNRSGIGRISGAGSCSTVCVGIVSTSGVDSRLVDVFVAAPDNHLAAGPHCRVIFSAIGRVGGAGRCPTLAAGVVSPAGVQIAAVAVSAPDDHYTTGSHCCGMNPASGRGGGGGGLTV